MMVAINEDTAIAGDEKLPNCSHIEEH